MSTFPQAKVICPRARRDVEGVGERGMLSAR